MRHEIIVPTGYMGSGSSAVTDYLSEFAKINVPNGSFEYIFMHCPDGIFDLEDKLLIGNTSIRSDEAIYRFKKQMEFLYKDCTFWAGNYRKNISVNFLKYVDVFLNDISTFDLENTYWYFQQMQVDLRMKLLYFLRRVIRIATLRHVTWKEPLRYPSMVVAFPTKSEYYDAAKKFIGSIVDDVANSYNNIVLDQFLLPHNLYRMPNYFDGNCKAIVVERDPRDVFVLNKYIWKSKNVSVPYPFEVVSFCKYYKRMRECEHFVETSDILRLHFEDLVYKYDEMSKKINDFLNISEKEHTNKFEHFDPKVSKKNTLVFNKIKGVEEEIQIIERELKDYLYAFDSADITQSFESTSSSFF